MLYYLIEWVHAGEDELWRAYLEMDEQGCLRRRVDAYRIGLYYPFELDSSPMDPRELAGSDGSVSPLRKVHFDDIWEQALQSGSFMGMMGSF